MKTNKPKSASHTSGHNHASRPGKVFDVARPGKTAPSSTTRPLIVTDRPMVKDPMMSPDESSVPAPVANDPVKPAIHRIGVNVQPPSTAGIDSPPTPLLPAHFDDEPAPAAEPTASTAEREPYDPLPSAGSPSEPSAPLATPPVPNAMPSIASEPPVPSPVAAPPQTINQAPPESHQQAPTPSSQDQGPLVDVAARNRASSMRLAVVGAILIIVVAIGCADAMLDAGALQLHGVPHTHFFKQ
ncbi:MAG TPA: hypothetical protein VLG11_01170 [Candidatus Saccharimonadales bacterium]|nr:hypothetical protein [Candidatus Saccharimonadales bacterium]